VVNSESGKEKKTPAKWDDGRQAAELPGTVEVPATSSSRRRTKWGAATGLAWTEVGGQLLTVECTLMEGKGKLTSPGKTGPM